MRFGSFPDAVPQYSLYAVIADPQIKVDGFHVKTTCAFPYVAEKVDWERLGSATGMKNISFDIGLSPTELFAVTT